MALETLTGSVYIDDLVATNPATGDSKGEGDDHLRGIKNVLLNSFPSITGPVTATQAEINTLDGITAVLADLNLLAGLAAAGLTGTELGYVNGVTSAIQTQLTNALARANHTGTQTMSTISDAGALATLSSVAAAQIDANAVGSSEIAADAVGHAEKNWTLDTEGSWSVSGTRQVIPEGIFVYHNVGGGAGTFTMDMYSGSTWRNGTGSANLYGTLVSDGSSVGFRQTSGTDTVYYRRLA